MVATPLVMLDEAGVYVRVSTKKLTLVPLTTTFIPEPVGLLQ